jgi:hypothetical protein
LIFVGHVAPDGQRVVPDLAQLALGGVELVVVDVGQGDGRAGWAKARAVAGPMPEPAPVTNATRPVKS